MLPTRLVEVAVHLWPELVDQVGNLIGQMHSHALQLLERTLLTGHEGDDERSQGPANHQSDAGSAARSPLLEHVHARFSKLE